ILAAANSVIKINKTRLDKSLWTSKDDGDEVEFACVNDEQAEADYVCRNILKLVSNGGYKFSDFAVLMRLNALSMPFEEKFLSYNIPYKIFGGFKFFERVEIKNIIAYLRLFVNPDDEISFLRVINFPKRGIGQGAIDKLKLIANANNVHLLQAALMLDDLGLSANSVMSKFCNFARIFRSIKNEMENLSIEEIVVKVVNLFSIKSAYNGKNESDDDKKMNIDNFIVSAEQFTAKQPEADLCEYLESISLVSDLDGMEEGDNNVKIATVHAVKGLEFKVVFVVGLEEKIFPIQRASSDSDDLEEERRLMYVAITRAEEKLFLTKANTRFLYGKRDYMIASRFLGEAGFYDAKSATSGFASRREENKPFLGQHSDGGQASQFGFSKNIFSFSGAAKAFGENKKDISIYKVGQKVLHSRFGEGVIKSISLEEKCADIDFCGFGVKTLMLEIAPLEIVQ
ncbi:MAG: 3'-5' exonuclease, partial [Clostridia bacterium]